jgi:hypothetical protein
MLFTVVKTEIMKLRRAPVWIAFFTLPLLAAVMGISTTWQNIGILTKEWYSCGRSIRFFQLLLLPSLNGVLCAYQWRLEHRENNWNSLMNLPVRYGISLRESSLFRRGSSFDTGADRALFIACGKYAGFTKAVPPELARWLFLGVCAGIAIASVQLLIAMLIKILPFCWDCVIGGISGLVIASNGWGLFYRIPCWRLGERQRQRVSDRRRHPSVFCLMHGVCASAGAGCRMALKKKRWLRQDSNMGAPYFGIPILLSSEFKFQFRRGIPFKHKTKRRDSRTPCFS